MREYLIRRFKPTKHLAIRDYFANLPGVSYHPSLPLTSRPDSSQFDFPFIELFGPANELDMIRLERMFRFPEGPRLFSENPNDVAALRAAGRLTKFLRVLTIYAAKFIKRFYPTRHSENAEDELFNYYYAVYEAVNRHLGEDPDWQSSHTNDADLSIIIFLVNFILLGRKRVFDMHPDEGDLGIAADQLVDEYEKKTGRI
jgi:hypothetical protein